MAYINLKSLLKGEYTNKLIIRGWEVVFIGYNKYIDNKYNIF